MRLFRFKDDSYTDIEEIRLDKLDLKKRRTIFIFPGFDNPSPKGSYPPKEEPDLTTYGKMTHSLPRGVVYGQQAQKDEEPFEVVMATWDSMKELLRYKKEFMEHPGTFFGEESMDFTLALYKQGFNPDKVSMLAWSYGSAFVQQCANCIRQNPELEKERMEADETASKSTENGLPPIYAATTATVTNPANNSVNGFPGFYMYAKNDKTLEEFVGDEQKTLYNNILGSGRDVGIIKTDGRDDHVMAIVTTADKAIRRRPLPATPRMMRRPPDRRRWNLTEPEPYSDPKLHGPPLFMEVVGDDKDLENSSTYTDEKGNVIPAWRHARYFQRAFANILTRKKPITFEEMLFNTQDIHTDSSPSTSFHSLARMAETGGHRRMLKEVHLSQEIKSLLSRFQTEVDEEGLMLTSQLMGTPNFTWERDPDIKVPLFERDQEHLDRLRGDFKGYLGKIEAAKAKYGEKHGAEIAEVVEFLQEHLVTPDLTEEQTKKLRDDGKLVIHGRMTHREIKKVKPGVYSVRSWYYYNDPNKPPPTEEALMEEAREDQRRNDLLHGITSEVREKWTRESRRRRLQGLDGDDLSERSILPDNFPGDDDVGRS